MYKISEKSNSHNDKNKGSYYNVPFVSIVNDDKPSIYFSTLNNKKTCVGEILLLFNNITENYLEFQRKNYGRFRYENNQSQWKQIQKLTSCRGFDSIAL